MSKAGHARVGAQAGLRAAQVGGDRESCCKSFYLAENGKLVVQGNQLDEMTKANLINLLAGKGAVEIDVDIVRAALERLM